MVPGQQDGLLQCHTEGAAVAKEEKNEGQTLSAHCSHFSTGSCGIILSGKLSDLC